MHISASQRVNCFHVSEQLGWPPPVARPRPASYWTRSTREVSEAFRLALDPHQSIYAVPNSWTLVPEMVPVCTTILILEIPKKWVEWLQITPTCQCKFGLRISLFRGPLKYTHYSSTPPTMCGMSLMLDSVKLGLYFYLSFLRKLL